MSRLVLALLGALGAVGCASDVAPEGEPQPDETSGAAGTRAGAEGSGGAAGASSPGGRAGLTMPGPGAADAGTPGEPPTSGAADGRPAAIASSDARAGATAAGDAPPAVSVSELPFRSVGLGPFAVCYIDVNNKVACFGRAGGTGAGGSRDKAPPDLPPAVALSGHHVFACGILKDPPARDDAIRCWGSGPGGAKPPRIAEPIFLTSGDHHVCALSAAGAVTCWGASGHTPPAGLRAKRVASLTYDCAIAADDRVICWGPDAPMPPDGLRAKRIATGGLYDGTNLHACAVALDDGVVCWGVGRAATDVPAGLKAKEVASGNQASCAIRLDDTVVCWGGARPPAGLKARALLMSYGTAAAVTFEGRLLFWGDTRDGKDMPPSAQILF